VIRSGGESAPLFMTYDGDGEIQYALALAPHIDNEVPIYALPYPVTGSQARTVEGAAARLAQMVLDARPSGPYRIAGRAATGVLAYELAAQLLGADQQVQSLCLIGADALRPSEVITDDPREWRFSSFEQRSADGELNLSIQLQRERQYPLDLNPLIDKCKEIGLNHNLAGSKARQNQKRGGEVQPARTAYTPFPLPVDVYLFEGDRTASSTNFLSSWTSYLPVKTLHTIRVSGDHYSMFRTPNVEKLGELMSNHFRQNSKLEVDTRHHGSNRDCPLVVLRSGETFAEPLVCLPGAGNPVTSFIDLVECVSSSRAVYGVQYRGLDGLEVPYSTIHTAIECYLTHLNEICPKGSIHLLGHSFGGWIALELAIRLSSLESRIASLTIIDSDPPDERDGLMREYDSRDVFLKWVSSVEQNTGCSLGICSETITDLDQTGRLILLHERLVQNGILAARSEPRLLEGPLRTFAAGIRTRYTPAHAYQGPATLVLATERGEDSLSRSLNPDTVDTSWRRWIPRLKRVYAPGNHMTLLRAPLVSSWFSQLIANDIGNCSVSDQPC
jgi:thioesterase domain-containing protein